MTNQSANVIRFGDYLLDRADERLIGPHGPVRIGNKAFRVIDAMARTHGRLLTKNELFETVWDGTIVSDSALTSVIKELRHALHDDRRMPRYIANVYGRGYRFLAQVEDAKHIAQPEKSGISALSTTEPARPRRVAERRLVTAMSVDLTDVVPLDDRVDPELLAGQLARFAECITRCIAAGGGQIIRAAGDGFLVCFGWPNAREDAAECAIRAGFSIISEVRNLSGRDGSSLQSRVGIATGMVLAGGETDGAPADISLVGEAPTLAAELRHMADPGTIVMSEATHRQVGRLFACELLAKVATVGFPTPLRMWRPLRPTPQMSRFRAARTVTHSFVGRVHELSLFADRWRAAAEGNSRTVVILGEAGMGKSRLVDALAAQIAEEAHAFILWQCSPYHQVKPLYPVVEYLTHAAGIHETDVAATQLKKLTDLLDAVQMPLDTNLALLAQLLSIPADAGYDVPAMPANSVRAATIGALVDWLERVAAAQPLLFVVEDAHWIDATTLEVLTRLVGWPVHAPLLAVVTARPEFASPWNGRAEVSTIGLDRLHDRDCETLAREIVGAAASSDRMVADVVARSDGNPLFVEELSAAVLDLTATGTSHVPDSLQNSLMARLDGLGEAKILARTCSVLGRRFARPLLSYLSDLTSSQLDENLTLLVGRDVIRPIGNASDGRYEFKHALLRDAAYESMLFSVRRRLHEATGRFLELHFPDVVRTEPELLAQHFSLAGLTAEAGKYAERAGDRASVAGAFQEAIASFEEALRQNDAQPSDADRERRSLDLLLKLGPAVALFRGAQDPALREIYRRAEALSLSVGDSHARFKAVWGLWYNANISRDLDDAGAFSEQLVGIAEQLGDDDLGLEASHCRWSSALFSGDFRSCLTDARQGSQRYDRDRHHKLGLVFGGHDPGVCAYGCLGQAQLFAGHVTDGFASVETAIALAEKLGHPGTLAHGLLMGLIIGTVARTPARLQSHVERTLDLARQFKLPPQEAIGTYHLAWIEAETGNREKGVNQMGALYDRVTAIGPIVLLYKVMYVEQLLAAGQTREALGAADKAIAALRCPDRGLMLSELLRLRGECLAALGQGKEAIVELARAEAMAKRDGAGLLRLRAANSLHRVAGRAAQPVVAAARAAMPAGWSGPGIVDASDLIST